MTARSLVGVHADILLAGPTAVNRWKNDNPEVRMDLKGIYVVESDLSGVSLENADLSQAVFLKCTLYGACLDGADLARAQFLSCDLRGSKIRTTDVRYTTLIDSSLDGSDFSDTTGFSQIRGLQTCRVEDCDTDVHFEMARCRSLDRIVSWSKLRFVGRLRLFLPSYAALVTSVVVMTLMGYFNEKLSIVRDLSSSAVNQGILSETIGNRIVELAHPWHATWRHVVVLIATLCIAVASTLFLFCPSRVREFTIDQWVFSAKRPSFEYHTETWAHPLARACCATAYAVGGLSSMVLLGDTFCRALLLVIHSLVS